MRFAMRWLLAAWTVVVLLAVAAAAGPRVAPEDPGGTSAAGLTALFQRYGDTSGDWLGADRTASVPLPDGRRLWLFSDTFLGRPDPGGARPRSASLVHNSAVVQDGGKLTTLTGGSPGRPASLFSTGDDGEYHWVGDASVLSDQVQVLVNRIKRTGPGPLDHVLAATDLATLALPTFAAGRVRPLPVGDKVSWGSEVMTDGAYTYIYGSEAAGQMKFAHVARVRGTDLGQPWEFWTGRAWSAAAGESGRLLSGVGTSFGVRKVGDRYVLVTHENNLMFSADFVAYTATAPTGPFEGPHYLFRAPEPDAGHIVYDADLHLDLSRPGSLLVSYNVNDLDEAVAYADASIYRPRFFEVPWPPRVAGQLPPAPAEVAAAPDGSGTARVTWKTEGGRDYRVYRRDVTAGQTHFVRLPGNAPGKFEFLTNGHRYEFAVSAVDKRGEGALSPVAGMTATVPPPPAPAMVRAEPDNAGKVTLHWTEVPFVQLFKLYYRDLTTGQRGRTAAGAYPGQSATIGPLRHGHEYEFTAVAVGGGGDSVHSKGVRATVVVATPPAPGTPSAQTRPDGTVLLSWPQVAPGLAYKIYQRDATAGTTDWGVPGISRTTQFRSRPLEHGREYEFVVAAVNDGGEGTRSPVVRVRAQLAPPGDAPTRLRAEPRGTAVELSWRSRQTWHWIYRRDVTAGEKDFTREEVGAQGREATLRNLVAGHEYELKVAAFNPGGAGPQSSPVRVRVGSALPTGLAVVATGPGTARLTWQEIRSDVLYRIQVRDASAGEQWRTDPYPVDGSTYEAIMLIAGHQYEFRVQLDDLTTEPVSVTAR
ncbi:hypothetical protein Aab01nite_65780 [Paractinoplanes abujensis]|nr:hypothetical protein Aab01nite_65780 [Actinoplanes abujensis]